MKAPNRSEHGHRQELEYSMKPIANPSASLALFAPGALLSKTVAYDLTIARQERKITGHRADGRAVQPFAEERLLIGVAETYNVIVTVYYEAEYDTKEHWETRTGASYILSKHVSLLGQWHSGGNWDSVLRWDFLNEQT